MAAFLELGQEPAKLPHLGRVDYDLVGQHEPLQTAQPHLAALRELRAHRMQPEVGRTRQLGAHLS